jgi:hypothetical protein
VVGLSQSPARGSPATPARRQRRVARDVHWFISGWRSSPCIAGSDGPNLAVPAGLCQPPSPELTPICPYRGPPPPERRCRWFDGREGQAIRGCRRWAMTPSGVQKLRKRRVLPQGAAMQLLGNEVLPPILLRSADRIWWWDCLNPRPGVHRRRLLDALWDAARCNPQVSKPSLSIRGLARGRGHGGVGHLSIFSKTTDDPRTSEPCDEQP